MGELKYLNKFFYHYRKRIITGIIITIVARIFALVAPNLVGDSITLIEEYSLKNSIDMGILKKRTFKEYNFYCLISSGLWCLNFYHEANTN